MENLEKEKSVWVIGDIHGLYDPLKKLINEIRHKEYSRLRYLDESDLEDHEVVLIFLGDYINGGPSSKECLDFLIDLEFTFVDFRKIFLSGNHEDMLQQFLRNKEDNISDIINDYGIMFFNGNGGETTVESFMPTPEIAAIMREPHVYEPKFEAEQFIFPQKYQDFFDNLQYSHEETISEQKFLFSHSLFAYQSEEKREFEIKENIEYLEKKKNEKPSKYKMNYTEKTDKIMPTLDEQLAVKNYDEYHKMRDNRSRISEELHLWNRKYPKHKFDDFVVIHGHTPTQLLKHYMKEIPEEYNVDSDVPFFFFDNDQEKVETEKHQIQYDRISTSVSCDQVLKFKNKSFENLISIDIDTGATLGNALTAVNIKDFQEDTLRFIQVFLNKVHRRDYDVRFLRVSIPWKAKK